MQKKLSPLSSYSQKELMETKTDSPKASEIPYDARHDKWLNRVMVISIAVVSLGLLISGLILLAIGETDSALIATIPGSGGFMSVTTLFLHKFVASSQN